MADEKAPRIALPEKITLNFPYYGALTFSTLEEIAEFIRGERSVWDSVPRPSEVPGPLYAGINAITNHLNAVEPNYNQYRQELSHDPSTPSIDVRRRLAFDTIVTKLHAMQQLPYLHSKSELAQRILVEAHPNPLLAHAALTMAVMPRSQLQPGNLRETDVKTITEAVLFLSNGPRNDTADVALTELQTNWSQRFVAAQEDYEKALTELTGTRARLESDIETKRGELAALRDECLKQVAGHAEELARLRKAFNEEMLLRAPADYWQTKYEGHNKRGWWLFGGLTLVVVVIIGGSLVAAPYILGLMKDTLGPTSGSGWVGEIALITVPALAAFWLLRAVSRLFAQQTTRMGDALERNTMVKTYLALLTEPNHKVEPAERLVILQALFRPGPDDPPDTEAQAGMLDALHRMTK